MSKSASSAVLRAAALRFVADRAVVYLLQIGEPAKTGQVTGFVNEEHPVSAKVVRDALTLDPRFIQHDRRWDLAARQIDTRRPVERVIEDFIGLVGRPLLIDTIGVEIAKATGQTPEATTEVVRRLVTTRPKFQIVAGDRIVPASWLLNVVRGSDVEDTLFDNFEDDTVVTRVRALVKPAEWIHPVAAAAAAIDKAGDPLLGKALAYLAYEIAPDAFCATGFHDDLLEAGLVLQSNATWITPKLIESLPAVWDKIADEPPVEGAPEESSRPAGEIAITPADMEEISAIIRRSENFITSRQLLEQVLEVNASDRDYAKWEAKLATALQEQGEVISVGWDRWRRPETIPTDILDTPPKLEFETFSFQTLEGEELDVELTEDGLDGNLKTLVTQPMALFGGECKKQKDGSGRCTVTILHHESGTLPISGDQPYFPTAPTLLEATITGPNGKFPLWVNNQLGIAYGLDAIYANLPESGGVFTLTPANRPGEYKLEVSADLDPIVGIDEGRLKELRNIALRPTFAETSTFDLVGEFLERHRKGADFFTLLAEIWVIRPVSAALVASLLSEYYCFKQNKNGSWSFDPRDADKGFKKAKRKYVK